MSISCTTELLANRIAAFDAELSKKAPANVLEAVRAAIADIVRDDIGSGAIRTGAIAPAFTLPDARGEHLSLNDLLQRGPVVMTFYRGAWCPYCDLTLRAYQARTLSMVLLVTPALGVVISAFTLREPVGASLIAGVFLIAAGIHLATRASNPSSCPAS